VSLGVAASLAACGERAEPTGEVPPSYPVTVEGAADDPVVLEALPERIVVLDRGPAQMLDALGAGDRIVGAPAGVTLADGTDPDDVVTANGRVDVEAVVALSPDLIVATPEIDAVGREQASEESGAALYLQPSRTADDVVRAALSSARPSRPAGWPSRCERISRRSRHACPASTPRRFSSTPGCS
jgi:ABC-type Fe3+-hydroxamate transport system substrate-binding protein